MIAGLVIVSSLLFFASSLYFKPVLEQGLLQTLQILGRGPCVFPDGNLPFPPRLMRNVSTLLGKRRGRESLQQFDSPWTYVAFSIASAGDLSHDSCRACFVGTLRAEALLTFEVFARLSDFRAKFRAPISMLYVTFFSVCFLVRSIWIVIVYSLILRKVSGNNFEYVVTFLLTEQAL
ncbi:hypothetical protein CDL15_Pgr024381 [Punica granatum]|uniref:Uncharacterized protein n=1 Tax=Punica granatum TaxID=22663 RepID=A0A218XXC3_PUNGR|nr:hypothetical protein CDL15_Pgr024381 [Punica granatum]